jgi:hypothetical protein
VVAAVVYPVMEVEVVMITRAVHFSMGVRAVMEIVSMADLAAAVAVVTMALEVEEVIRAVAVLQVQMVVQEVADPIMLGKNRTMLGPPTMALARSR